MATTGHKIICRVRLSRRWRYLIEPLLIVTDPFFEWTVDEIYAVLRRHTLAKIGRDPWRSFERLQREQEHGEDSES